LIPVKLEDWTYEKVNDLVQKNINESDRHDFKHSLPDNLMKICCAFANTKGGFIILGVEQFQSKWVITGIDEDIELAHRFGQKVVNINPSIDFDLPKILKIPKSKKVIAIIHIPLSDERPHIPSVQEKRRFWKRTNKGNSEMSYEEIRLSFQRYEERREKIKLLYTELLMNLINLKRIKKFHNEKGTENLYLIYVLDSQIIMSLLTDLFSIIGKDSDLIFNLMNIRHIIQEMTIENNIFHTQLAFPTTNQSQIVSKHNKSTIESTDSLIPVIQETLRILETKFKIKNPFNS
jgi:hypothetical protein